MRLYDALGAGVGADRGGTHLAKSRDGGWASGGPARRPGRALVRPDGHLAWRGTDAAGLRAWLDNALGTARRSADAVTEDDWRARKKAATKHAIQEQALRLFAEKGYDATTVDEIAAAAGVSHMTFFRYFPRKEEVVEYDEYDPLLEELIAARPPHEPPLVALHNAIRAGLNRSSATDRRPCWSGPGSCCAIRCCDPETSSPRTPLAICSPERWPAVPALPSPTSRRQCRHRRHWMLVGVAMMAGPTAK